MHRINPTIGRRSGEGGYTVIELTLFLALSGLFLAAALVGTSATIRSIRFSDSARSLHSFVQKQFDEILNGVNTRQGQEACANSIVVTGVTNQPGASGCLLLGKMLKFVKGTSTVQVYLVVGTEPTGVSFDNITDDDLIALYEPHAVRTIQTETYSIPWLATVSDMKRMVDKTAVDSYALIRSPRSSRILSYTFKDDGNDALKTILQATYSLGRKTNICVKSADSIGRAAEVTVATGQGQDSVALQFDIDESTECKEGV